MMQPTPRLHYDDPLALAFNATVVAHATFKKQPSLILSETLFYPESGGQMGDRGILSDVAIIDVQIDTDGVVHHLYEGLAPAVGNRIEARVDEARRREHMALHTGQHCLSRAVLDQLEAITLSSRLGERICTLDVDRAGLTLEEVRDAAAHVNAIIDEDRPVRAYFPSGKELAALDMRKPSSVSENIRVVHVEGYDITPCGGTHCTRTSQIQLLYIAAVERYKGGTRISFSAGPRARHMLVMTADQLRNLAKQFDCGSHEIFTVHEKAKRELHEARSQSGILRRFLAERMVADLRALDTEPLTTCVLPGGDLELLRMVAKLLTETEKAIAVATPVANEQLAVITTRGEHGVIDCGKWLRAMAQQCGGKGGGKADFAQGRFPAACDFEKAARTAYVALQTE